MADTEKGRELKIFIIFATVRNYYSMLRKQIIVSILLLVAFMPLTGQEKLQVMGGGGALYLSHTVKPGENWYSVGRIYNISPKEIAPFNHGSMDKPLAIGQELKIPLTGINFSQDGTKAADEVFVPLYHKVGEKEWMYRISTLHYKVPVETLQKWNHITNDQLRSGMLVIVGYLKVKPGQSALATKGTVNVAKEKQKVEELKTIEPKTPETKAPETKAPEAKPAEVKQPEVKVPETKVPETKVPEAKPVDPGPVPNGQTVNHRGGSFRKQFGDGLASITGNAGIFRSTSGWNDGKYYALMNNVPIGTIVKVSFSSTNKTIYAKVLGQLPEMKESTGLALRISDAAASELGVENTKFFVEVRY